MITTTTNHWLGQSLMMIGSGGNLVKKKKFQITWPNCHHHHHSHSLFFFFRHTMFEANPTTKKTEWFQKKLIKINGINLKIACIYTFNWISFLFLFVVFVVIVDEGLVLNEQWMNPEIETIWFKFKNRCILFLFFLVFFHNCMIYTMKLKKKKRKEIHWENFNGST